MVKNRTLVLFLVIVITLSSVYAVEIVDRDIGNYKLIGTETKIYNSTAPQTYITYKDDENATYIVIIEEYNLNETSVFPFETENRILDIWVKRSSGSLSYGNNIVYFGHNNREVFWAYENYIIIVKAKQLKFKSSDEYVAYIESDSMGEFSQEIINGYLEIYPSECSLDGCFPIKPLSFEESHTFDEPPDLFWLAGRHNDRDRFCPTSKTLSAIQDEVNTLNSYLKEGITEDDINQIYEECKTFSRFKIAAKPIPDYLADCVDELQDLISVTNLSRENMHQESEVNRECYIRNYFDERFPYERFNSSDKKRIDSLYEKRKEEFINFIKYKMEYPVRVLEEERADVDKENNPDSDEPESILNVEIEDVKYEDVNESERAKYEFLPTTTEKTNIPSKSLFTTIKELIGGFFKWF